MILKSLLQAEELGSHHPTEDTIVRFHEASPPSSERSSTFPQLRWSASLLALPPPSSLPPASHLLPLGPTLTLERDAAVLHSITCETSRCYGDNGLLARPPLPEASQKLGAASEDAVFGPGTNQHKQRHSLWLLRRRQLFSFSKRSLLMPVFPLGSQRLVEQTMPSSIFSLHKNPFNFLIVWQTAPSSLPSPFCSSPLLSLSLAGSLSHSTSGLEGKSSVDHTSVSRPTKGGLCSDSQLVDTFTLLF